MISRSFLQGLPEERKRGAADYAIISHVDPIKECAAQGKTSYMFEPDNKRHYSTQYKTVPVLATEDFVAAFQRKFPDCTVTYQEVWIDIDATSRVLKRGILIDWS